MSGIVKKKTISAQVADILRQKILSGEYEANTAIRQEHIAAELGVSRIPVREALHQLYSEGFVELVSHKGAVVSSISLEEILELYELRARIETWLIALAIPRMVAADFARAEISAREFAALGAEDDYSYEHNWNFHAALYAASGRKLTIEMVGKIHLQIERYERMMVSLTGVQAKSDREHWQLMEFCHRQDTDAAVALLEKHILDGGQILVERLKAIRDG
ncbi:MAG: GntR family transcriptional regulator [Acetobacter sp.]|uniref:GntR family transcriptional regulator n=1 Tax=Acetobacter sp. TaxID=440 RepID=UPI0039ECA640